MPRIELIPIRLNLEKPEDISLYNALKKIPKGERSSVIKQIMVEHLNGRGDISRNKPKEKKAAISALSSTGKTSHAVSISGDSTFKSESVTPQTVLQQPAGNKDGAEDKDANKDLLKGMIY